MNNISSNVNNSFALLPPAVKRCITEFGTTRDMFAFHRVCKSFNAEEVLPVSLNSAKVQELSDLIIRYLCSITDHRARCEEYPNKELIDRSRTLRMWGIDLFKKLTGVILKRFSHQIRCLSGRDYHPFWHRSQLDIAHSAWHPSQLDTLHNYFPNLTDLHMHAWRDELLDVTALAQFTHLRSLTVAEGTFDPDQFEQFLKNARLVSLTFINVVIKDACDVFVIQGIETVRFLGMTSRAITHAYKIPGVKTLDLSCSDQQYDYVVPKKNARKPKAVQNCLESIHLQGTTGLGIYHDGGLREAINDNQVTFLNVSQTAEVDHFAKNLFSWISHEAKARLVHIELLGFDKWKREELMQVLNVRDFPNLRKLYFEKGVNSAQVSAQVDPLADSFSTLSCA